MPILLLASIAGASASPCASVAAALAHTGSPCGTNALMSARALADREGVPECFLEAMRARGLGAAPVSTEARAAAGKALRDDFGVPNLLETENFAVRWGSYAGFDDGDVEALAAAFEDAWLSEIGALGFPPPATTDTWKFNVYIGDTGQGAPTSGGAGGYFWYDGAGYPMIVIGAGSLAEPLYAASAAAHEFNHAIQASVATYDYAGQGAWYWEASASWAAGEVYPTNPYYALYLPGMAFLPELPVNFFDYPDSGSMQELHQYGAFLFVRYMSEFHGGTDTVVRSWVEAPSYGDPLDVLDGLLAEQGTDVRSAFTDFADRAATWDFSDGDLYAWWIDAWGGWSSPDSHRPTGTIDGTTDGWVSPPSHEPRTYGINYWELDHPPDVVEVAFEGEDGPDLWHVSVATRTGATHARYPLAMEGNAGSTIVADLGGVDEALIVVAAADGYVDTGKTWSYSLSVQVPEPIDTGDTGDTGDTAGAPPLPDPDDTGSAGATTHEVTLRRASCACDASPAAPIAGLWLCLAVAGRRRHTRPISRRPR